MTFETSINPDDQSTAEKTFLLAEEYRKAAEALKKNIRQRKPFTRAPYHLTAMHAIELYLNASMLFEGVEPARVREFQHDFAARAKHALASGLQLRSRTAAHLIAMKNEREYVVSRYGTDQIGSLSPISRLQATLNEICAKVGKKLGKKPVNLPPAPLAQSAAREKPSAFGGHAVV